jgi:hypothetical protein
LHVSPDVQGRFLGGIRCRVSRGLLILARLDTLFPVLLGARLLLFCCDGKKVVLAKVLGVMADLSNVMRQSESAVLFEDPLLHYLRSDLKPARTSSEKSCGCSQAAKCPPLSSLL